MRGWHLYGIYIADDLQYIGCTENPDMRRYQHSINRFAGRDFTLRTLRTLKSRAAAVRAEAALIRKHRSPMNIAENPNRTPVAVRRRVVSQASFDKIEVTMRFRDGTLPIEEARPIWFGSASTREALAKMPGWSATRAYEVFGPSGRIPNRWKLLGRSGRSPGPKATRR
jgi:predicted GIY-YIG superfamily endonuclease